MKKTMLIVVITAALMVTAVGLNLHAKKNDNNVQSETSGEEQEQASSGNEAEAEETETRQAAETYEALGFVERDGAVYFPDAEGNDQTGWQKVDDRWYYFSPDEETFGQMVTGKQTIDGKMYYFSKRGKMRGGWIEFEEGKYYFAVSDGYLLTGLQYVEKEGRYYWFDEEGVLWGNFGILSSGEIGLIREAMGSWNASVTQERLGVIARGLSFIGNVTYSQHMRNEPTAENPDYLDCSSFVGNCYYYGAGTEDVLPRFCTDNFLYQEEFTTVAKDELIPGDIFLQFAEGHWQTGNHIGIYIGELSGGEHVFMHCAGDVTEQNNIENRGIWITIREDDEIYRKYHNW